MNGSENVIDFAESWGVVKRRKWSFLAVFTAVLLLGIVIAVALPPVFRAESKVLIERQQIPDELVTTTVTGFVQERIELISQRILTADKLLEIGRKVEMPGADISPEAEDYEELVETLVSEMIENIHVDMVDVQVEEAKGGRPTSLLTVAFTVAYEAEDPELATRMANELTAVFLAENSSLRTEQASKVTSFLDEAGSRIRSEITEIEAKLTDLKGENFAFLPDQLAQTRETIALREDELMKIAGEIAFLESRKSQIAAQMAATSKHVISDRTDLGVLQDPRVRLEKAQIDLKNALETFTENHPDVRRLKLLVSELQAEVSRGGSSASNLTVPTNPEYLRLQEQYNEADAKLSVARGTQVQMQEMIRDATSKLLSNPGVEARYNALVRDLERAQKEYADIKDRAYQAQLAQSLEQEQRGERFTLLTEASVPRLPIRPNRIGIVLLAGFFGFLAGGVRVVISEAKDRSIRTSKDVAAVFGVKPIAVIPVIDLTNI